MEKKIFNITTSRKSYLWAMFLPQILSIAVVFVFSLFCNDVKELPNSIFYLIVVMLIAQVAFFIIIFKFSKKNKIKIKPIIKETSKSITLKNTLICALISVIAVVGLVHFVGLFTRIFEKIGYTASETSLPNNTFGWFLVNVVIFCIIPAIMEELLFRGIIFNGLKKLGFWTASILSAVMFMTVHLSVGSIVYPLIMGVIFCLIYKKTGNIIYPIITHLCNNFIIKLVEYLNIVTGANILGIKFTSRWQYLIVVAVAVIAVALIYLIIKHWLADNSQKQSSEVKELNNDGIQNVVLDKAELKNDKYKLINTFIVCGLFWLLMCIISFV